MQISNSIATLCALQNCITKDFAAIDASSQTDGCAKNFEVINPTHHRWSVGIHAGAAIPIGTFTSESRLGFALLYDVCYRFSPQLSVVCLLGYNDFTPNAAEVDDIRWTFISPYMKYRLFRRTVSPCISVGVGCYIPMAGNKKIGAHVGLGLDYGFNNNTAIECGINYHVVLNDAVYTVLAARKPEICSMVYLFSQFPGGLILKF